MANEHTTPLPAAAGTDPSPADRARHLPILGRRRRFLLKPRSQIRLSVVTAGIVLIALVVFNLSLYSATMKTAALLLASAPEMAGMVKAQDRVEVYVLILASSFFVIGALILAIVETHRTVGAAFNIERKLGEMARGDYSVRVKLRKRDQLRELEAGVNKLGEELCRRTREEAEILEQLGREAESIAGASPIAARLHQLAESKRTHVSG